MEKLSRNKPRDVVPGKSWYYVNRGSVDLVTTMIVQGSRLATLTRLKRKMLNAMLAELRPLRPKGMR